MVRETLPEETVLSTRTLTSEVGLRREELRRYLVVIEDDAVVARFLLGLEPLTVGRDPARDVILDDNRVSRLHLQIFVAGEQVIAEDLGSSNGTHLEGQRLTGRVALEEGQALQVGSRLLKYERHTPREVERAEELRRDLDKAGGYVRALLPEPMTEGSVRSDWFYRPSAQLGGDAFSTLWLDDSHVAAYLVDVCGHGVHAAMHSVSVLNVLRQRALAGADFFDPAQVLAGLNSMFPMEAHDGMYFTIWYGVYSVGERLLSYASGGHPPAILRAPDGATTPLKTPGPMIGALSAVDFAGATACVPAGSVLYLFSDGVFETVTPDGRQCGLDDFLPLLDATAAAGAGESERIYHAVRAQSRPGPLEDDFSLLVLAFH